MRKKEIGWKEDYEKQKQIKHNGNLDVKRKKKESEREKARKNERFEKPMRGLMGGQEKSSVRKRMNRVTRGTITEKIKELSRKTERWRRRYENQWKSMGNRQKLGEKCVIAHSYR